MKNIFFPNKDNSYYPHILKPISIGLLLIGIILVKIVMFASYQARRTEASDLTKENILNAINNERALRNLSTLNTDPRLGFAAQEKSDDMQARHYFAHVDPDGHYVWDKIVAAGYTPYAALGENLAIEFYNTESLVTAWMNSPTHRQNILNESFKDQGMGINLGEAEKSQYHSAITNTFGSLLPAKAPVSAAINSGAKPTATTPKKTPAVKSQTTAIEPVPTPTPTPSPLPSQAKMEQPIIYFTDSPLNPREERQNPGTQQSINQTNTTTAEPVRPTMNEGSAFELYDKNRKLNLGLAALLILLLLIDLKIFQKEKYPNLDKKLNNLALLFLAIVITAILYWI